jgi:hypothetical protein
MSRKNSVPRYTREAALLLRLQFEPAAKRYRMCGRLYPVIGVLFILVTYAICEGWLDANRYLPLLGGIFGGVAIFIYWARHPSCPGCKAEVIYQGNFATPPRWCPMCGSPDINELGTMWWSRCKDCRSVLSKSPLRRYLCRHCKNCGLLVDEKGL